MKIKYLIAILLPLFVISSLSISCSSNDDENYIPLDETNKQTTNVVNAPITLNLSQVPYPNLSDYHFFDGALSNQNQVTELYHTNQQAHYLLIMLIKKICMDAKRN